MAEFAWLVDCCGGWHTPRRLVVQQLGYMAGAMPYRICLVLIVWVALFIV